LEIILFWIGLAVVIGVAADYRGRFGFGWTLLSLVFSPILIGLLLFVIPNRKRLSNPLNDIATLALIEATPEGSHSRQLLAEYEEKVMTERLSAETLAAKRKQHAREVRWVLAAAFLLMIVVYQVIRLFVA
jgi:hypothetical protein